VPLAAAGPTRRAVGRGRLSLAVACVAAAHVQGIGFADSPEAAGRYDERASSYEVTYNGAPGSGLSRDFVRAIRPDHPRFGSLRSRVSIPASAAQACRRKPACEVLEITERPRHGQRWMMRFQLFAHTSKDQVGIVRDVHFYCTASNSPDPDWGNCREDPELIRQLWETLAEIDTTGHGTP
jgi:hypothetical protein